MPPTKLDPESERRIQGLLTKSGADLKAGHYQSVINNCREILNLDSDNAEAQQLMEDAQSKLEAAAFVKDNLKRANEYFNNRDYQKCISECQRIQLLDPDNAVAEDLLKKAQQKVEAEPFIQNFISSGQSLFASELYSEAIGQWEKVRSIDPKYPGLDDLIKSAKDKMPAGSSATPEMPMFDLGNLGMGDSVPDVPMIGFDEDMGIGGTASTDAPHTTDEERISVLLKQGDAFFQRAQYQKAIETWSEIFMLDVSHPVALKKIEEARAAAGQKRGELKDILTQGQEAYEQGEVDKARSLFDQVIAIDPSNAEALKYLDRMGAPDKTPASLEELIALGDSAEESGKYREAAQYFSQALALDTENAVLADRIKNINLLAKKQEQSKQLFGNARAFLAEGKTNSARHALAKILETDPSNQEALDLMQEVKDAEAAGPIVAPGASLAGGRPAGTTARGKKPSMLPKIMIGGVVLVLGAVFFFYSMMHKPVNTQKIIIPRNLAKKKTPEPVAQSQPVVQAQTAPAVVISPADKDKAIKMVQEATFYYEAKHLPEAQKMVQDALTADPDNKDAQVLKKRVDDAINQAQALEQKMLNDANSYFNYSEYAGAVELYEKYLDKHPETKDQVQPQIIKCYYNLGVLSMRTYNCDRAADYFRQVLFIDQTDQLSKDALAVAHQCQKTGVTDIEVRKAVALMEMRK